MQSCEILITWRSALQTIHVSPQRLLLMALSPSRAARWGGIGKVKVSKADPSLSSQGHPLRMRTRRFWLRMGWQVLGPGLFPATGTLMWRGLCVHEREGRLAHASSIPHHTIFGGSFRLFTSLLYHMLFLLPVPPFVISRGSSVCFYCLLWHSFPIRRRRMTSIKSYLSICPSTYLHVSHRLRNNSALNETQCNSWLNYNISYFWHVTTLSTRKMKKKIKKKVICKQEGWYLCTRRH